MVTADGQLQFSLQPPAPLPPIEVRMRRFGDRWVAQAGSGMPSVGMATSPAEALKAALGPLGDIAVTRMLADLALLEPSIEVARLGSERSA
jgi:hypothetical protein